MGQWKNLWIQVSKHGQIILLKVLATISFDYDSNKTDMTAITGQIGYLLEIQV